MLSNTAVPKYYGEFRDAVIRGEIPINAEIEMEMHRIDDLIDDPDVWYDDDAIKGFVEYCEEELTLTDGSDVTARTRQNRPRMARRRVVKAAEQAVTLRKKKHRSSLTSSLMPGSMWIKKLPIYRWTGTNWEDQGRIGISLTGITSEEINAIYNGEAIEKTSGKYLDVVGLTYLITNRILTALAGKVDVAEGKGLSTNDFTDALKDKIGELEDQTTAIVATKVDKITGKGLSSNDFTTAYKDQIDQNASDIASLEDRKVDKVDGMGLSSNDFDDSYVEKIESLLDIIDVFTKTRTIWRNIEDSTDDLLLDSDGNPIEGRVMFAQL